MYVLVEPDPVTLYLGKLLAHIICKNRIIPLLHDPTLLPNVEINPGEVGDTRYFCKKHQDVEFSCAKVVRTMFHATVHCVTVKNATTST